MCMSTAVIPEPTRMFCQPKSPTIMQKMATDDTNVARSRIMASTLPAVIRLQLVPAARVDQGRRQWRRWRWQSPGKQPAREYRDLLPQPARQCDVGRAGT